MRLAGVVMLTLVVIALGVPPAQAGTYTVWSCADPDTGRYAGTDMFWPPPGWTYSGAFNSWAPNEDCSMGRPSTRKGFMIAPIASAGYVPGGDHLEAVFKVPPDTEVASATVWRDVQLTSPNVYGGIVGNQCHSPCEQGLGNPLNSPSDPFSPRRRVDLEFDPPLISFYGSMGCSPGAASCLPTTGTPAASYGDSSDFLKIYAANVTIQDERAPSFAVFPAGSLLDSSHALAGVKGFSTKVTDKGGGLAAVALEVDGRDVHRWPVASSADAPCVEPYDRPVPCPLQIEGSFDFDTAELPDGSHAIRIKAIDAANNQSVYGPFDISTVNDPVTCLERSAGAPQITAGLGAHGRRSQTVNYRRRVTVRGRALDAQGHPLARVELRVLTRVRRQGEMPVTASTIVTTGNGTFAVTLGAGPSRDVTVGYRERPDATQLVCSHALRVNVRAGVGFTVRPRRVSSRGRIQFRGRLAGGPGREGVQVAIYAVGRRARDRVPVEIVRTDRNGRFRFAYRFRRTFAPFTYRFRARVPRQAAYPYAATWSRIVAVRVTR